MRTVRTMIWRERFFTRMPGCQINGRQLLGRCLHSGTCQSVADTFQCGRFQRRHNHRRRGGSSSASCIMRNRLSAVILVCAVASPISFADQCGGPQIGTWTLLSYTEKDPNTGEISSPYGLFPTGVSGYAPDCHMYEMIVSEHRAAPASVVPTDAEKITLFEGLIAFSGRYSVEGGRFEYQIEASWNQSWTGSTQTRQFRIEENNLYV